MKKFILLILVVSGSLFAQKYSEYELFQMKQFSKLDKMGLYVWDIDQVLIDEGFNDKELTKFAKAILDKSKIKTVDFQEARRIEGSPAIEIELQVLKSKYSVNMGVYAAVRFIQDVILDRDRTIRNYSAITWERDSLFFAKDFEIVERSKDITNVLLKEFAKEYKAGNSK